MLAVINIVVVVLVLLIAYWWATQGLFSAIIHLICVITAGALAFAFWEPLTVGLLLQGGWFDSFAWGVSLILLFAGVLLGLRLVTNKLVPANIDVPRNWSVALGFPVGAASGVLTVGILIIGIGFLQSQTTIGGYTGWARDRTGEITQIDELWLPVHQYTSEFYSFLSVGSLGTPRSMRHFYPDLHKQAASLIRDSARDGRGQISMRSSTVDVTSAFLCPRGVVLSVRFDRGARDYGEQVTLSASQIRLVAQAGGMAAPYVAHPRRWNQEVKDGGRKVFVFDDISHYVTTVPGREQADVQIEFPWPEGLVPAFVQIKGARIDLPRIERAGACDEVLRGGWATAAVPPVDFSSVRGVGAPTIRVANDIRPVRASTNLLPGSMDHTDRLLSEGYGEFPIGGGGMNIARNLQINGIYEPPGTRIVQVDASRESPATIFGPIREAAGADAVPMLVDEQNNTYSAIGYIHETREGVRISLAPGSGLAPDDIPHIPTAGGQSLRLIFRVTTGSTIVGMRFGDVPVVRSRVDVKTR